MAITRQFRIATNKGYSFAPVINVNQFDKDETWLFTIVLETGEVYTPSTGAIIGIKSDGNIISNAGTVNSAGQVVITETEQMTASAGKAVYELLIDGGNHGTANFIVDVEKRPTEGGTVSESNISLIEQAIVLGNRIVTYGSPLTASTVAQMTDHEKVYVYTGSESGYTNGHWYFWNGSAWTDGGVYNAVALNTDKTLSVENMAADGKATGDAVADLKNAINNENEIIGEVKNVISWNHTVTHSSTKDIIEFNVKAGEKITLEAIANQNVPVQMFVFTGIGTGGTRIATPYANTVVDYTAETDLMSFGLYVGANDNYNDQDITFVIKKENALTTKITEAEKNIEQNTNDILLSNNKGTQRILPYGNFQSHGLQTDGSFTQEQRYRVSNDDKMTFDYDITVNVSSGFRWGYIPFVSDVAGAWSGWKTTPYTIPAGTIFNMQIARVSEVYTEIADVKEFTDAITISTISLSRIVSLEHTVNKDFDYSYNGALIETKKGKYNMFQSSLYTPTPASISATSLQGFGIANGYIVQMYSGTTGKLSIVNMATGSVVASIDSNCEHGNSIDFFDTYYANDDILPVAFVSDGLTNRAYEARITASEVTILKNIVFPVETVGYFISTMLDRNNLIVYTAGYKQNSYTSATNNNMIICAWDYSNLTDNGDSTYTPEFIKSFNVPFFTTLQGPTFYNGKLFIISSVSSMAEANTRIFVINPYEERIENILTQFPDNIKNVECEAMYFYETDDNVVVYVRSLGSTLPYYIMEFNS